MKIFVIALATAEHELSGLVVVEQTSLKQAKLDAANMADAGGFPHWSVRPLPRLKADSFFSEMHDLKTRV